MRRWETFPHPFFSRILEKLDPDCSTLKREWYVPEPQETSDLRAKGMDNVAASVFVLFADPEIFRDNPMPALRYAWATAATMKIKLMVGPYQKKYVKAVVVRAGKTDKRRLVREERSLISEFETAFGRRPEDGIHGIALFTDNDDAGEPVVAHYA